MKFKRVPVKFRTDGLAEGQFLVYPSTFTKTPDAYGDVVAPGAFKETIDFWKAAAPTAVLSGYYGHRMDDPDYNIAWAEEMGEDEHGWWVKGQFDLESPKGPQTYRLVKSGRISQLSFAYDTLEESTITLEGGRKANELRKLHVHEFSFVPVGANRDTSIEAVKSAVAALPLDMKVGRVLAQKHIDSLRSAQEAIAAVITAAEAQNEEETSGADEAKTPAADEEPTKAKSAAGVEEPSGQPSVDDLGLMIALRSRRA